VDSESFELVEAIFAKTLEDTLSTRRAILTNPLLNLLKSGRGIVE
jgi:hypothetical protein